MAQQNYGRQGMREPPPLPKTPPRAGTGEPKPLPPSPPPPTGGGMNGFSLEGILKSLGLSGGIDSDRILILGLLLLLSGEDCDRLLMLALMYILL